MSSIRQLSFHISKYFICFKGDSGGPIIQRDQTGRATVVGVVSYGLGCGERGNPGVYTRVSYFIDWILQTINNS